jgi:hypothetical protein
MDEFLREITKSKQMSGLKIQRSLESGILALAAFSMRLKNTSRKSTTQSGDAGRDRLGELGVSESDVAEAVCWARLPPEVYTPERVKEFDEAETELATVRKTSVQQRR